MQCTTRLSSNTTRLNLHIRSITTTQEPQSSTIPIYRGYQAFKSIHRQPISFQATTPILRPNSLSPTTFQQLSNTRTTSTSPQHPPNPSTPWPHYLPQAPDTTVPRTQRKTDSAT